ncbi:uncharacterized protein LACBIDRAFT_327105 [Laccaria bicolor S238N-H82]|uniref:Predicted protein n=1 Tax=Laccaria bicolor (strain S238N-H82 / ATCC MYA-4686) TaxID=486041 RepID=B0DAN5_LACBS|nr:uncharacterized protein LACBIDRAFT_327105 [Laccaria bicolor S238N-H82]EDR08563.1 predicted protein [Laccaria bicolor S238N-H82]|eukprot:XP_001880788.1 predicted protein [Laccaria bicolor S238N-H82]
MDNNVGDVEVEVVDREPLLRVLKRNWAKGARLTFLESYIDNYKNGLLTKKAPAVLDSIVNAWFARFHWTIPLSAETDLPATTLPVGPDGHEILTKEHRKLKAEVVERTRTSLYGWFEYRCKKIVKLPHSVKGGKDPMSILISRLLGQDATPPKRNAPWEAWAKVHFPEMKATFNVEFKQSGKPRNLLASARNEFKMAAFKRLDEAERQRWEDIAQQEHLDHKKRLEDLEGEGLMDPEAAQEVLDRLPNLLGLLIQAIREATGMHLSVLVGGPEPKKKGQLNMFGIHHGTNLAPSPKSWPFAEKEQWNIAKEAFLRFLSTCYTTEQQRARAIIPSTVQSTEQPTAGPSSSFPSGTLPPSTQPSPTPLTTIPSAPPSNSTDLKTRRKRKAGKGRKNPTKKAKRARISKKNGSAITSDGKSDPSSSDAEESPTDDEDDSDDGDDIDDGNDESGDIEADVPALRTRSGRSGGKTSMDPSRWKKTQPSASAINGNNVTIHINTSTVNSFTNINASPPASTSKAEAPCSLDTGDPYPPPQGDSAHTPRSPLISQLTTGSVAKIDPDPSWPEWFRDGYNFLTAKDLGMQFTTAVNAYVQLESHTSFQAGSRSEGFKPTNRPTEVAWWVA